MPAKRLRQPLAIAVVAMVSTASVRGATSSAYRFRNYDGTENHKEDSTLNWGAVGENQLRGSADADYVEVGNNTFLPPGDDRPTAREIMSEVFLSTSGIGSPKNALFVAFGQLLTIDMSLTLENASEPFGIPCNAATDIWCPDGEASDPIPFYRSSASVSSSPKYSTSALPEPTRNPINYATAFLDLDFLYGRNEATAESLRKLEGGLMLLDDNDLPLLNDDGTWQIADQRTARYPVTFALHVAFLREHNRCCDEVAPALGFSGDEDLYIACRRWTIATYQHIHEEDFEIQLLDGNVFTLGSAQEETAASGCTAEIGSECYDPTVNAGADVFALTAVTAAFESALPSTVRVLGDDFEPADEDMTDLVEASKDLAGFVERNGIGPILRGAVLSKARSVGAHFPASLSNLSPLFKLPVDAVQSGRDHGLASYNDARGAYKLSAKSFEGIPGDDAVTKALLSDTYGGNIDNLDAFVGAVTEESDTGRFFGDLLQEAWLDQVYRVIIGDGLYHNHSEPIEDVELVTMSALINRTTDAHDIPLVAFQAPDFTVCSGVCSIAQGAAILSDAFELRWTLEDDDTLAITLRAKLNGDDGWLGIGFGGLEMTTATDFIICEAGEAEVTCTDRQGVIERLEPQLDDSEIELEATLDDSTSADWTQVTFKRDLANLDVQQDYDLKTDLAMDRETQIIFAYRQGAGVDQHPSSNRGSAGVFFLSGKSTVLCEDGKSFYALHGALMLVAWMVIAPVGIYFARYRKGQQVLFGRQWYGAHAQIMVLASEAILPLAITAIFATSGDKSSAHARWGFFMIAGVSLQLFTGWLRTKALEGKQSNFSQLHRMNKHFHIWAGRFAYLAGALQCYRGVSMVSSADNVIFSALDIEFELTSFGIVESWLFPIWAGVLFVAFLFFETRKQSRRFMRKGKANIFGFISVINGSYGDADKTGERLVPRTEELPLYTTEEFNDKVLKGQSWMLIDNAVIDISEFWQRHPGGRRLLLNAVGTDVTHEILGRDLSVGVQMAFSPHLHTQTAWDIVRSLVVGYIDEGENQKDDTASSVLDHKEVDTLTAGTAGCAGSGNDQRRGSRVSFNASMPLQLSVGGDAPGVSVATTMPLKISVGGALRDGTKAALQPGQAAESSFKAGPRIAAEAGAVCPTELSQGPGRTVGNVPAMSAKQKAVSLERFHVCPFLFREQMSKAGNKRPVFKYVFSCPGMSSLMVKAITGPSYFNLRIVQDGGKGVVERSYNVFPVYLKGQTPDAYTGVGPRPDPCETVVAVDTSDDSKGEICIEMWIRHVNDGVMSRMLRRVAKDIDNPAVQLQGPFIRHELTPSPVHRNIIMIAAGTGINPMVQTIQKRQELARTDPSAKARLHVVWQNVSKGDFFCDAQLIELQRESQGLLDIRGLVSGDQRRRNVPGAAFHAAKTRFRQAISPIPSSSNSNTNSFLMSVSSSPVPSFFTTIVGKKTAGSRSRPPIAPQIGPADSMDISRSIVDILEADSSSEDGDPVKAPSEEVGLQEETTAKSNLPPSYGKIVPRPSAGSRASPPSYDVAISISSRGILREISSKMTGKSRTPMDKLREQTLPRKRRETARVQPTTLSYGKVTRDVLLVAFGPSLMRALDRLDNPNGSTNESTVDATNAKMDRRGTHDYERKAADDELKVDEQGDEERSAPLSSDARLFNKTKDEMLDYICGTDTTRGQLSVIVSGPRGFVFNVEVLLEEMGVPRRAIVVLD